MFMNIQAKKLELVQLILDTKEPLTLKKVEEVLKEKNKEVDSWFGISDEGRKSIEQGLVEANNGELIPHAEVMKQIKAR